jgi:predicted transcriptional regulator
MITEAELRESFRRRRENRPSLQTVDPEAPPAATMEVLEAEDAPGDVRPERPYGVDGAQASRAVALRMLGFSTGEIADEMHVPVARVHRWLHQARTRGRLSDVGDRLKHHIAALAVDKLEQMVVDGKADAVFETLKGTGYLRTVSATAGDARGDGGINLQVTVELPVGVRSIADVPVTGQIAGAPLELTNGEKTDDGEG